MNPVIFTYRTKTDATAVLNEMITIASGTRCHANMSHLKSLSGITDVRNSDWLLFWTPDGLKNAEIKKAGKKWELVLPDPHSLRA